MERFPWKSHSDILDNQRRLKPKANISSKWRLQVSSMSYKRTFKYTRPKLGPEQDNIFLSPQNQFPIHSHRAMAHAGQLSRDSCRRAWWPLDMRAKFHFNIDRPSCPSKKSLGSLIPHDLCPHEWDAVLGL